MTGIDCIFAPVSSPNDAHYAIYCDGKWLTTDTPSGITMGADYEGNGLKIENLSYISTPPNSTTNGQLITYSNVGLKPDAFYDDYFTIKGVEVVAPNYSTNKAELGMTRLYDNQA